MNQEYNSTSNFNITMNDTADEEARREIHDQIIAFNNATSSHHRRVRIDGIKPLNILVHDSDGRLLGGLIADTYWGWLDIDDFWLPEYLRGNGLGKKLLGMAEAEAIKRGCTAAHLKTFSFQAPGFYQKCGYSVVGKLEGYPPGSDKFWMRKELN